MQIAVDKFEKKLWDPLLVINQDVKKPLIV